MVLFFGLLSVGLTIGCIAVAISLFCQMTIRQAVKQNEELVQRLKKVGRQKNYSTYSTLIEKTLIDVKPKMKWMSSRKLEQYIAREVNQIEKYGFTNGNKNIFYTSKFVAAVFMPVFTVIAVLSMIDEFSSQTSPDAQASDMSAADRDMMSYVAFTNGVAAYEMHDWETAALELSRVHSDSAHRSEARKMLEVAQQERTYKEIYMQGMSALMADQQEAGKKLLKTIPTQSYYYDKAQDVLNE